MHGPIPRFHDATVRSRGVLPSGAGLGRGRRARPLDAYLRQRVAVSVQQQLEPRRELTVQTDRGAAKAETAKCLKKANNMKLRASGVEGIAVTTFPPSPAIASASVDLAVRVVDRRWSTCAATELRSVS